MPQRSLRLAKETLVPLGRADLRQVVGGLTFADGFCQWAQTYAPECWNDISFERCPEPVTLPLEDCL